MGGYKAPKATIPAYKLLSYKESNIMMPTAEFLFFFTLDIFAQSVSVTRDYNDDSMFNVIVHDKVVTRCTSQRHAIEIAIIKFNEASEAKGI